MVRVLKIEKTSRGEQRREMSFTKEMWDSIRDLKLGGVTWQLLPNGIRSTENDILEWEAVNHKEKPVIYDEVTDFEPEFEAEPETEPEPEPEQEPIDEPFVISLTEPTKKPNEMKIVSQKVKPDVTTKARQKRTPKKRV